MRLGRREQTRTLDERTQRAMTNPADFTRPAAQLVLPGVG
jgi:hypothetical protein